ncbi:HWE histidine kinase domain-containing protein [Microvirga roseola]|uniref:HWE histidine kinase domain-containing protein n=1 Tax=Microvirga roseola TaxID=2883126 RepID=UPI002AC35FC4|nr:HWE histidine kinase domain-containing protein [Microvirga roseola]
MTNNSVVTMLSLKAPEVADFAAFADHLPQLAWMATPDGHAYWYNQQWYRYTGMTPEEMLGQGWRSALDPAVLPIVVELWFAAVASGEPAEWAFPIKGADGVFRPFLTRVQPQKDEQGRVIRWCGTNTEISEQQRIAEVLTQEKLHLETLNQTMALVSAELSLERLVQIVTDAGVRLTGAQFGAFFYNTTDNRGDTLTLYTISGVPKENFSKFPNPRATHVFSPTFNGEGPVRSDDILVDPRYGRNAPYNGMPKGHLPVRSYLAVPVKSRSGEVMGGLFFGHPEPSRFTARHEELLVGVAAQAAIGIDNARLYDAAQREIRERREAEKHRELLINELNHRVKNTLATVQSIAAQTLRTSALEADVRQRIDARLIALSNAHNLLTEHNWQGTTLDLVVEMALRAHRCDREERFEVSGPEVHLSPKTALAIAMALHELATNAIKYGALLNERGKVSLHWQVEQGDGEQKLHMVWSEQGGPKVTPPSRKGFGTRLIERGLAAELGGSVQISYPESGVVCIIDTPFPTTASREF